MKLDRLAIIDCEWAPSCHLFDKPSADSVDLIEWAVINMDYNPEEGWQETGRLHGLVQYLGPLPKRIQKLTGIDPTLLSKARPFDQWASDIELFTKNRVIVGHHIEQDYKVLRQHFERIGRRFEREIFCTLKEAKKQWPNLASYELNELSQLFDLPHENQHRALSDAQACWLLFTKCQRVEAKLSKSVEEKKINYQDYPWLSHKSRNLIDQLEDSAGILSFYSHKKLLHICACQNLKSDFFKEIKKITQNPNPLTDIKASAHPHLIYNQLFVIQIVHKFSPHFAKTQSSLAFFGVCCFKNKKGLLCVRVVKYRKEKHFSYIDFAEDKDEAIKIQERIEYLFEKIPKFAFIEAEELKTLHDKANKQRQGIVNKWKDKFCMKLELAGRVVNLKNTREIELIDRSHGTENRTIIKARIEHLLAIKKLRHQFNKELLNTSGPATVV